MKNSFLSIMWLSILVCLTTTSCNQNDQEPSCPNEPGYIEPTSKTIEFQNGYAVYYGDDFGTEQSDSWELSFYTDMDIDDLGNPIGPGQILRLSINAPFENAQEATLSSLAGTYKSQKNTGDFSPYTYIWGYKSRIDLPTGAIYTNKGTFWGDLATDSIAYDADLITEGNFTIEILENGNIRITGILVGYACQKRYFKYEGTIDVKDNTEEEIENSTLTNDIELNSLTKARLEDCGDAFVLGRESYRMYSLVLAQENVDLTKLTLTGQGDALQIEFLVPWNSIATEGIPEGTYQMTYRESNNGISSDHIIPFNIIPGYPNKFTYPSGTWYFNYQQGNLDQFARIDHGNMIVTREGEGHSIQINFSDCAKTPHQITANYQTTKPITIFKR